MMKDLQFKPFRHSKSVAMPLPLGKDYPTHQRIQQPPFISRSLGGQTSMNRVIILGSSGSGKSTLARQLGAILELPVIHLDRHYWKPGWVGTPQSDWAQIVESLIQKESWIIDGNYRNTLDMRLEAADTAIFLDLPPWLCAMRAMKRRIQYMNTPRPDISPGCQEQIFDPQFPQFVKHILSYPNRARPSVINRLSRYTRTKRVIWLQSSEDVISFLKNPQGDQFIISHFDQMPTNGSYARPTRSISK